LRVFKTRVLRRIFGPNREEVAEGWRRLYNEELHNLHTLPAVITVTKSRSVRCSIHGRDEKCIQNFGQKT